MLPFVLPKPETLQDVPTWNGTHFVAGNDQVPVLEYSENFAGWSDDLTAMHESVAGDSHPIDLASRADALAQVRAALPAGRGVVMEIGCSSGFFIRDLCRALPNATVIGADVVKVPLLNLARTLPGVPLIRFDLLQCPLPDACVDVLVMLNVLEHIEDDVRALQCAFKLLRPGGVLVLEIPAGAYLYDAYDAQLCHFRRYSAGEVRGKLAAAGFRVKRQSHLGFLLFPLFAAVKLMNKWRGGARVVVKQQVATTSRSLLVAWAMRAEMWLARYVSLPFGIRVLATAKKNA